MAIQLLTICEWVGVRKRDTDIAAPSWEQVEAAIRALNEKNLNDLYLYPDAGNLEDVWLAVGGGAGRYLVTGSADDGFPTLLNTNATAGTTEPLITGGQEGEYPSEWIVDLDTALAAVRGFYATGKFEGDWHLMAR